MEPTCLNIIYIRVCVFDTCGFHIVDFYQHHYNNLSPNLSNILVFAFETTTFFRGMTQRIVVGVETQCIASLQ